MHANRFVEVDDWGFVTNPDVRPTDLWDYHHNSRVGAGAIIPSQEPWYEHQGAAADNDDLKFRSFQADIDDAFQSTPASNPKSLQLAQLQTEYALWLATWEQAYAGGLTSISPIDIAWNEISPSDLVTFEGQFQGYVDRYIQITGKTPKAVTPSSGSAIVDAVKGATVTPVVNWWTDHRWEIFMVLGAVVGYTLLYANAKLAGSVQRSLK